MAGVTIGEFLVIEAERIVIAAGHLKAIGSRQLDGGRSSEFSTDEPQRLFRQSLVSLNSSKKSGGSFLDEFEGFAFDRVGGFHSQRALAALLLRGASITLSRFAPNPLSVSPNRTLSLKVK